MNILVIYPYIPYPLDRGTYQRTYHLLRGLAEHHTVDLIALSENGERLEHRPEFEKYCREVKFVPFSHPRWAKVLGGRLLSPVPTTVSHWKHSGVEEAIREQLESKHYDSVHVCDIVMAQYFLREHRNIPLVVDRSRVDLQYQIQQTKYSLEGCKSKILAFENMAKLWFYEKKIARRCRMQVVCGPDDKSFIRRRISRTVPVQVVPNGVDLEYFHPEKSSPRNSRPTIMFCGAMDYSPNVDALRWYFSSIHDKLIENTPDLQVYIVGRDAGSEILAYGNKKGVTVTGGVPDVRPYYRRSWLQIVPLRIGGGTRLKIVESLSIGTPVVSTSIGAQGLNLTNGSEVLIADSADEFITQVTEALARPVRRELIRVKGTEKAVADFSWKTIGRNFATAFAFEATTRKRSRLLDVPFDKVTMDGTLTRIAEMVEDGHPKQIATANVDFLVQSKRDPELRRILEEADLVLCDGKPLVWLSKLLRRGLPERVAGSDLAPHLLDLAERKGWKIFFLGGKESVLDQAVCNVNKDHPNLKVAGSYSPPFAPLEEMDHEDIVNRVRANSPDLLFVHFGCPKQEKWLADHLQSTEVPVGIGLGATIDFLAGTMQRAPLWMRHAGLEWVFRLYQEPKRLLKRYAKDIYVFGVSATTELKKEFGAA